MSELVSTTDRPTKQGWYWFEGVSVCEMGPELLEKRVPLGIVHVIGDDDDLTVHTFHWHAGTIEEFSGKWAGPLEPPRGR